MQGRGPRTHRTTRPVRQSENSTRLIARGAHTFAPLTTFRKRGKSVGKRVQHTPPTGTTLTEFRRFLNTDVGTLRMNAKSTHTFAPLTKRPVPDLHGQHPY